MNKELDIIITQQPMPEIWQAKFGTKEKPHYLKKCKICGKPYGKHYFIDCECPVEAKTRITAIR